MQAGRFGLARLLVGRSVCWDYGRDRTLSLETQPRQGDPDDDRHPRSRLFVDNRLYNAQMLKRPLRRPTIAARRRIPRGLMVEIRIRDCARSELRFRASQLRSKAITQLAYQTGLRHPRADRRMTKSEVHRMLQRLVYTGAFMWMGKRYPGSHEPLITQETFDEVQAVLRRKPRARYPKQRHAFMGLLTCARCGCSITAEKKKGKYVYYRCTGYKGACGNSYVREEHLAQWLGDVIRPIQITSEIAEDIATGLRGIDHQAEERRRESLRQLDQRRRTVVSKLDRGYDDFVSGRISEEFWSRKSAEWEAELATVDADRPRLEQPRPLATATAAKILELAKKAEFLYKTQNPTEQRRLLETVLSNCTFDRGSLCPTYSSPFDLFVRGNETGDWRGRRDSNPRSPA